MYEADVSNKGFINEKDFLYIIAKQKIDYQNKLITEASKFIYLIQRGCFYCSRGR
jgi:hypothetical protein